MAGSACPPFAKARENTGQTLRPFLATSAHGGHGNGRPTQGSPYT